MTRKLKNGTIGPDKGADQRRHRKRTPSIEIEFSRLKIKTEEKPIDAGRMLDDAERKAEEISEGSVEDIYEVSPTTIVIAANAAVLNRYKNKYETTEPYEQRIEKDLEDPVKMVIAGMMVDLDELLDNYRCEIKRIEIARKKRMKYLWEKIPDNTGILRKSAKWAASTVVGGSFWAAVYFLLKDSIGHWGAVAAGTGIAGAAFYVTSKKGAEFLSNVIIRTDDMVTGLIKRAVKGIYGLKKAKKLKILARALQQEMALEGKEYEIDYKTIKNIGKTMPSPFIEENGA